MTEEEIAAESERQRAIVRKHTDLRPEATWNTYAVFAEDALALDEADAAQRLRRARDEGLANR